MSHNPTPVKHSFNAYRWLNHYPYYPQTIIQVTDSAFHLEEAEQHNPIPQQPRFQVLPLQGIQQK